MIIIYKKLESHFNIVVHTDYIDLQAKALNPLWVIIQIYFIIAKH